MLADTVCRCRLSLSDALQYPSDGSRLKSSDHVGISQRLRQSSECQTSIAFMENVELGGTLSFITARTPASLHLVIPLEGGGMSYHRPSTNNLFSRSHSSSLLYTHLLVVSWPLYTGLQYTKILHSISSLAHLLLQHTSHLSLILRSMTRTLGVYMARFKHSGHPLAGLSAAV